MIQSEFTIGLRTARHEADSDSYEPEARVSEFSESTHSLALWARIKRETRRRRSRIGNFGRSRGGSIRGVPSTGTP